MDETPDRRPRRRADDLYNLKREAEELPRDRDEDRPRRRRDEDGRDDSDRPRRRRERDDPDEDDRPRRRRRSEDEEPRRTPLPPLRNPVLDKFIQFGVFVGLVLLVLFGVFIWYVVGMVRRAPFRAQMATYLAPASAGRNAAGPRPGGGKMVVVSVKERDLDDLHFDLPDNLRASTPDEAALVARLRWIQATVGIYKGGGSASQWSCEVEVIDRATWTMLGSQKIVGEPPPGSFIGRRGQSRSGAKPKQQVLTYIQGFAGK
jgi:hypothetical protein